MTNEKRNDEIDLIEVFFNIYIFFRKHFWFLFISATIGAILGYSTKFYAKEHYESYMLINSYTVSDNYLIEYFNNIQFILADGNYKYLTDKMEIDSVKLKSIKKIAAENVYNEKEKKNLGYIKITVQAVNNDVFTILNKGISNYLEKEIYVQNEIEIFKENNLNLISKIDEEIEKLEILQGKSLSQNEKSGEVNIINEQKSFQNELLGLLKEKQSREKQLKFATPYRVIQDFTVYNSPIKKTKTYTLITAFIFGIIALSYLIIKNINKVIKEKELAK